MRRFAGAASALAVVVGMGLGAAFGIQFNPNVNSAQAASSDTYRNLNLFGDVFERIRSDYVEDVKDADMIEAAIQGMLTSLDPHSSFLNAEDFKNMQVQTRGEFGGLGIEVTMENGLVRVVSPIDDTPADRAGIKAGDYITHIDGEQVMGLNLSEAVEKMRGEVNTKIRLSIMREGSEAPFDVELTRAIVKIQSVRHRVEGDVGYIRVTSFNEQTESGLKKAIQSLKKEIGPEMKGYVLDLRNNPGGLLDQAISVTDLFLDQGEIVQTRGRNNTDIQRYNATRGDVTDGKTVIVLINGGSASASEIVAGALQDHQRALVVGTLSFGKGSVQTIIPLGANGALRLTTAKYYTPSGRSIQAKGIEPDVVVEQLKVAEGPAVRSPYSEAALPGHLENPNGDDGAESGKKGQSPDKSKGKSGQKTEGAEDRPEGALPTDTAKEVAEARARVEDYQLSYALDLLRGISIAQKRVQR